MLHFAPRYGIISACLTPRHAVRLRRPANDNGAALLSGRARANDDLPMERADALLEAALKLFAAHGLAAATRACEAAEIAAQAGDEAGAEWWLAVCATFDSARARSAARAFEVRRMHGA